MDIFKRLTILMLMLVTMSARAAAAGPAQSDALIVDALWLQQRLADKSIVIVDARDRKAYLSGHIAGAVNIPVAATFSPTPPTDRVANISYIQKLFGGVGISADRHVVIYDNGEHMNASRVFWVLEVYGHNQVSLLNGGYADWTKKQYPVSRKDNRPEPTQFVAVIQPQRLATRLHTLLAIGDDSKVILDARTPDEYAGKTSIAVRAGRIPSAINIPFERNFADVGGVPTIKSFDELKLLYKDVDQTKKTITYCNKGKHSSFTYFVLRQLGHDVSHYDGSWYEWGNDTGLPIEK